MSGYRLSDDAAKDLAAIEQYSTENFGTLQSNRYRDRLKERFSVLVASPRLYPSVNHILFGCRRSICGAHSIYYCIEGDTVEIIRILGNKQSETKAFW